MPSCLDCGEEMNEVSRKIIKGEMAKGTPNFKVDYHCENVKCGKKGHRKAFLDDGMMFIPLPDK